jgi:hypothetical protein
MTSDNLLKRLSRKARRVSQQEMIEANRQRFEAMGLDLGDIERMAAAVDLEAMDLLLMDFGVSLGSPQRSAPRGRPGRRESTRDIAIFAHEKRLQGKTWNQIFEDWTEWHPHDMRVTKPEDLREAHRRFFGDKARKAKDEC